MHLNKIINKIKIYIHVLHEVGKLWISFDGPLFFCREWSEVAPIGIGRILPGVALLDGKVYVVGGELESCIMANGECYDPRDNVWTSIACMVEPRCEFGLCALDNSLYAFGGWVGEDIGGSIETYDSLSNTWTLHGELPEPRFSMGVVAYEGSTKTKSSFFF